MAPKKQGGPPKKTVDEVNAEYTAKMEASAARVVELKRAVAVAKKDCDAARLDLVAVRENRVYFEARVAAEAASNEMFEQQAREQLEAMHQTLRQVKRSAKDKSYELGYVREVAAGVDREMATVQNSISQIEADCRLDTRALERELDRLASVVGALEAERPRVLRTMAALHDAEARYRDIAPVQGLSSTESPLQLTLIGSSSVGGGYAKDPVRHCFHPLPQHSVLSSYEVMDRVEASLARQCGFDVVERVRPDTSIAVQGMATLRTEEGLLRRVESALVRAASGPSSLKQCDDLVHAMVVIHCPSRTRPAVMPDGTVGPHQEIVLILSQLSDDAKQFLRASTPGRHLDLDGVATVEIPLSVVVGITLSSSKRQHVTLVVDTWPAPSKHTEDAPSVVAAHQASLGDDLPSLGVAMYWSKDCMKKPLLYQYKRPIDPTLVRQRHSEAAALDAAHAMPRACMLESLCAVVDATSAPQLLDNVTVGRSVELMLSRRFGSLVTKVEHASSGPFSLIALEPAELRVVHHSLPLHRRPLPSPQPLHVEGREDVPPGQSRWEAGELLSNEHKWRKRTSLPAAIRRTSALEHLSLTRHYAEATTSAPHIRFLMDAAVEDPSYHVDDEEVEDLAMERSFARAAAEEALERSVNNEESPSAIVRVTRRRQKRLSDDHEEWGDLLARRLRQALIGVDEDERTLRAMMERSGMPAIAQVLPPALGDTAGGTMPSTKFTVRCAPLDEGAHAVLHKAIAPDEWYIEGKRCPERTVMIELALVLDVKHSDTSRFANVTQAKDALCHSVKRRLELLCERTDNDRPQDLLVQVAFNVEVRRLGGPADDAHFAATLRVGCILTEHAMRSEGGSATASIRAKRWLRTTLTVLLRRWDASLGSEWLPCAEATLATPSTAADTDAPQPNAAAAFRVTRLFHVVRNWELGLRLDTAGDGLGISVPAFEKRLAWLQHTLRTVLMLGGALGGVASFSGGADTASTCARLLDVREFPTFVGIQRRGLLHGMQTSGDDILGPQSRLDRLTEGEIAVAVDLLRQNRLRGVTIPGADAVEAVFQTRLASNTEPASATSAATAAEQGVVLLAWLVPQTFSRVVQPAPSGEALGVLETEYLVQSLVEQFHKQQRVAVSAAGHDTFLVATTVYEYDDTETSAVTAATADAVRLQTQLTEALFPQQPLHGDGTAEPSSPLSPHRALHIPLEELAINRDEDTGDASTTAPPATQTGTDGAGAPVPAGNDDDADDPAEYDESFRPLGGACLYERSVHASSPGVSLFALPQRFWHTVLRCTHASRGAAPPEASVDGPVASAASRVQLVAVSWPPRRHGSMAGQSAPPSCPDVLVLNDHLLRALTNGTGNANASFVVDDAIAVRSKVVELFLQHVVNTTVAVAGSPLDSGDETQTHSHEKPPLPRSPNVPLQEADEPAIARVAEEPEPVCSSVDDAAAA